MEYSKYTILKTYNHELKDPLFRIVLEMVATWANEEGLMNRKCTNFAIQDKEDELVEITCEIEQDEETKV